jgi:HJR/Mrr/RecB family endonuclease
MNFIVNFYSYLEDTYDSYEEVIQGIETDNIMYLTAQIGDIVVVPTLGECEYVVEKVVKKFFNKELDIYISKVKSPDQLMEEVKTVANKTIRTMLDSFKDAKIFDFSSSINSSIINPIKNSKNKDTLMLK